MTYPLAALTVSILAAFVVVEAAGWLLARSGFPLPLHENRLGCVDGLRGFLAVSVMAHHFVMWLGATRLGNGAWSVPAVPAFNELGAGAVALFFMITGLVFYRRVLDGFARTSWPALAITRVFRILPLLVFSVAAVSAIAMSRTGQGLHKGDLPALAQWISAWSEPGFAGDPAAGRINAYVLWSLRFEWLFYLAILPAMALAADLVRGRLPSVVLPAALLVVAALGSQTHVAPTLMRALPHFAIGMLAAEVRLRPGLARRLQGRAAAAIALVGLFATAVVFPFPVGAALPGFGFFFVCVACGNDLFGLLRTRGALVLGEISFSIYLLHGLVLSLFFVEGGWMARATAIGALPVFLPLLALAAVLVSSLTYLAIERPAIRLGAQLARGWTNLRIRTRSPEVEFAP